MDILTESFQVDFIAKDDFNIKKTSDCSGCTVCGDNHETELCSIFDNLQQVKDSEVPVRSLLTLPSSLKIESLSDGSKIVIALCTFPKGTQFGPFQAKQLYSLNPFANFPIKIFSESDNMLPDCYLDTTNEEHCNWMCYVPAATNSEEQNLICYQLKQEIYFSAMKDIQPGEQLKVWYSTYYALKMGVSLFKPKEDKCSFRDLFIDPEKIQKVAEKLPPCKLGAEEKQNWICRMCNAIESNVVTFAKHLQRHYVKMLNNSFICDICNEGFATEKCLTKHRKINHTVFTKVKSAESNSKIAIANEKVDILGEDACIGPLPIDQLMNEALSETDHSSLLLLDQLDNQPLTLYSDLNDVDTLREILCDDNTKASKTAQEKSIADFSLELVESENTSKMYNCDICNKQFQTLQYLCRHLKKHTGEYTCLQCLMVFTRKENLQKHSCFINDKVFNCTYCPKSFLQKKYLIRHMGKHTGKYTCNACGKQYSSLIEKQGHNCPSIPLSQKKVFSCQWCNKKFLRELYLRKHIKSFHKTSNDITIYSTSKEAICDICAEKFKNVQSLKQHMLLHSEPKHECVICHKKFHRRYVLTNHLLSHGTPQVPCQICGKKLKNKKSLGVHLLQHGGEKKYTCDICGKKFLQRTNMLRHQETHLTDNILGCNLCDKTFASKFNLKAHQQTHHFQLKTYRCQNCDKAFSKNHLLKKHYMHTHLDRVYSCPYCSKKFKHRNSIRRHLRQSHSNYKTEWSDPVVISSFLVEAKNLVNKETLEIPSESLPLIQNNTNDTEQQITLGKNAFILEDGTIVQPQEEGNIMIYVLNQQLDKN